MRTGNSPFSTILDQCRALPVWNKLSALCRTSQVAVTENGHRAIRGPGKNQVGLLPKVRGIQVETWWNHRGKFHQPPWLMSSPWQSLATYGTKLAIGDSWHPLKWSFEQHTQILIFQKPNTPDLVNEIHREIPSIILIKPGKTQRSYPRKSCEKRLFIFFHLKRDMPHSNEYQTNSMQGFN